MYRKRLFCATAAVCFLAVGMARADEHPVKDSYITTKVKAELTGDFGTRARHISVSTKDGVVALTGRVDSAADKERAVHDTRQIKGVSDVIDKLEVKP